ncbi:hypothetical protein PCANC_26098 [Puccinia coronata f. sp. avenae]|uniref:Uncharacterized protein n=1 Tax=Puccinia coronata f. sp. avenae TaxID=200324 RepID=A0A2N5RYM7_9BASI|nr:hypothetical protein PCANC_26098 [Puccinia coronata f. sp. avenae]
MNQTQGRNPQILRAIQDAIVLEEPVDARYGQLYALSDLTCRLLTAAPFAQRPSERPSEAPTQIAKIMLEKNFAALLSNALADVDLNFPSVQRLLNYILRPLEHLTKRHLVEDEEVLPTEEDAPDLYRNSALGLYEGDLERGNRDNSPNTSEEEDQFDDDDADMDTAGINRSNTAVRAVLEQPCSTGGRTGTVRPKQEPTGRTDLSDRSRLVLCDRSQELIGQACPTRRQVLRSDSACPTTSRTRLFEHRSNCRVRPVNAGSGMI